MYKINLRLAKTSLPSRERELRLKVYELLLLSHRSLPSRERELRLFSASLIVRLYSRSPRGSVN